jgi:hypothetical protein
MGIPRAELGATEGARVYRQSGIGFGTGIADFLDTLLKGLFRRCIGAGLSGRLKQMLALALELGG